MVQEQVDGLEKRLCATEAEADVLVRTTAATLVAVKGYKKAIQEGDLREMRKALEVVERNITTLKQQSVNAREAWDFEEEKYLASAEFRSELVELAKLVSLEIFEQDERLYCYPSTVRVLPSELAVLIDKKKERKIRPSLLIKNLKELQNKPVRFKPEVFLEILFSAYSKAVAMRRGESFTAGIVIALSDIYDLLTPLPGQSTDYSRRDLAIDIYSLDRSGLTKTKDGFTASFPASTGTKSSDRTITVITPTGQEKKYYGIAFSAAESQLWP
jgi:hypothetical protein